MTYEASEASKHGGKPVELYRYEGTYQTYRYTSGPVIVPFQAPDEIAPHDYLPIATRRTAVVNATQNDDSADITIELPVSSEIVAIYGFQIAPPELYLTLFRGHNPGEFIRYWGGHVENIQVARGTATIRVPSEFAAALAADMPNVFYQGPCNHNLGDPQCGIDLEDYTVDTALTAVSGTTLTVTAASVGALDGLLTGGDAVLASGERRMIIAQSGDIVEVSYPFSNANVADTISLIAGCDLAWQGDCKTKFDNTINFGGFPLIPSTNVFASGIEPTKDVADVSVNCFPSPNPWTLKLSYLWTAPNNLSGYSPIYSFGLPQAVTAGMMPNGKTLDKGSPIAAYHGGQVNEYSDELGFNLWMVRDNDNIDSSPGGPIYGWRHIWADSPTNTLLIGVEYYFFFPLSTNPTDRDVGWGMQFGAGSFMGVPLGSRGGAVTVIDRLENVLVSFAQDPEQLFPFAVNFSY